MAQTISLLNHVRIASPCGASWADMTGDDRTRFCHQCKLNVYNFSEMTRGEAEQLILAKQGRLCAQYYARADGTIITRDCPIGWQRLRRGLWWSVSTVAAVFSVIVTTLVAVGSPNGIARIESLRELGPFCRIANWLDPPAIKTYRGVIAGTAPSAQTRTMLGKVRTHSSLMGEVNVPVTKKIIPIGD